jgi:hypothetical protein
LVVGPYTLTNAGDAAERVAWQRYLATGFPAYQRFWQERIVELTGRPAHIYFKTDAELSLIGRGHDDLCLAQLHYTVLTHLEAAWALIDRPAMCQVDFTHAIIRLSSVTDVADEFLERLTQLPGTYKSWSEEDGQAARIEWRKRGHRELQPLRSYRNRLVHGRVFMNVVDAGTGAILAPRIGLETGHIDWRLIQREFDPAQVLRDYAPLPQILVGAWGDVLNYLQANWTKALDG